MGRNSKIEWCNHTMNPWRGCTKISPGCRFCYADVLSHRNPKVLGVWGDEGTRVLASEAMWYEPIKWDTEALRNRKPALVFCASLADIFEDWKGQMTDSYERTLWVTKPRTIGEAFRWLKPDKDPIPYTLDNARTRLFHLIRRTPNLRWLLLTKRPENIATIMPRGEWPNVWLGTSVETQEYTWRLDALQEAPQKVPVRFCSAEPLIGSLDLRGCLGSSGINWLIIGGESGSEGNARPFNYSWCRDLIKQCRDAKVSCFVKQVGDNPVYDLPIAGAEEHGFAEVARSRKGGDPDEWPGWMRVREFPKI